jgi:uncharacterized iron-regulated protein
MTIRCLVAAVGFILISGACSAQTVASAPVFYDVARGSRAGADQLLPELKQKRLILVGEHHTDKRHHAAQLAVIRLLHESGLNVAVGLEMFRAENAEALRRWVDGDSTEAEIEAVYYDNWNYAWSLYRDIFHYARQHRIPMVGLNVARDLTSQVARSGFQSLDDAQRGKLSGIACRVDREYMDYIRKAFGTHGHGDLNFVYFCEAQMVWDSVMAVHAVDYLKAHPERMMVLLAGSGHAHKQAIPAQIRQRADLPLAVVLPETPGRTDPTTVDIHVADYLY